MSTTLRGKRGEEESFHLKGKAKKTYQRGDQTLLYGRKGSVGDLGREKKRNQSAQTTK